MKQKLYHDAKNLKPPFNLGRSAGILLLAGRGFPVSKTQVQVPALSLFYFAVLQANSDNSKALLVALANSNTDSTLIEYNGSTEFDPGSLLAIGKEHDEGGGFLNLGDQHARAMLGYYTDRVEVRMSLDKPYMTLQNSFPTTANESGSIGSSDSTNVGAFGGTLTGGIAHSDSSGRTVKDFTLVGQRQGNVLTNVYKMTKCADGSSYDGPKDMWPDSAEVTTKHVKPLRGAPEQAYSGFTLNDWAIWVTPSDRVYDDTLTLDIAVKAHMVFVANDQETETAASAPDGMIVDQEEMQFKHSVQFNLADVAF